VDQAEEYPPTGSTLALGASTIPLRFFLQFRSGPRPESPGTAGGEHQRRDSHGDRDEPLPGGEPAVAGDNKGRAHDGHGAGAAVPVAMTAVAARLEAQGLPARPGRQIQTGPATCPPIWLDAPARGARERPTPTPRATKVELRPTFVDGGTDSRSMHEPGAPGDYAYMTPSTQSMAEISAVGLYRVDPTTSSITFKTRHLFGLGRVRGRFELHDGEIHVADPVSGSWAAARISTASFRTRNPARDAAVLSSRLLDAYRHPFITFTAAAPPELGPGSFDQEWALHGQLTVCGTTAALDLTIEHLEATTGGLRLRATSQVDRYDFGVTKAKGWAGRHLQLSVEVVATRVPGRS
jgi:polyisoprenoid-binding protein YceI